MSKKRLLAVLPHPDDESYGCAGTLLRAARDGTETALVCLTHGEASQMGPERGLSRAEVAELRKGRMKQVKEILGLGRLMMPGLPDRGLARYPFDHLAAVVREVLEQFRPQVVIGHDPRGVNAHPDHIATHWALRRALEDFPGIRFAMLAYTPDVCEAVKPRLLFPTPERDLDCVVHLTPEEIEAKEACLRVHEAFVTVLTDGREDLVRRPPVERYDFFGEVLNPPATDLFANLPPA